MSSHRQAVRELGDGLEISARAPDGVVEAIEDPMHPFYIGVGWHPERLHTEADRRLLAAFLDAAKKYEGRRGKVEDKKRGRGQDS